MNKSRARKKRIRRVRSKIKGTAKRPRLAIFRSAKYIYAQLIDDQSGKTLAAFDSRKLPAPKGRGIASGGKNAKNDSETASRVGKEIGRIAKEKKISRALFDKHGYKYHGRVKALADGARESGLKL